MAATFRATVFGSTGATGRDLVAELAASEHCTKVNAVTRREVKLEEAFPGTSEETRKKIKVYPVDYENLKGTIGEATKADVAFCALGTTHGDAGGAKNFRRVDLDYVTECGKVCRAAGIDHFHLVTAAGTMRSCPRFFSNYVWTKARSEEAILSLGFKSLAIWHPGFLDRGVFTRKGEQLAKWIGARGLPVADLARAMCNYAEQIARGERQPKAEDIIENKGIRELSS